VTAFDPVFAIHVVGRQDDQSRMVRAFLDLRDAEIDRFHFTVGDLSVERLPPNLSGVACESVIAEYLMR
jgi:hypothetical protein